MARQDALLRLHNTLLARRAEILKKLREDMDNLRNFKGEDGTGDSQGNIGGEQDRRHRHWNLIYSDAS